MNNLILQVILAIGYLLLATVEVDCFATKLTGEYCHLALEENVIMMKKPVKKSDERRIQVFDDNGNLLKSDDLVNLGDQLVLKMEPKSFNVVWEVSFNRLEAFKHYTMQLSNGACDEKLRSNDRNGARLVVTNKITEENGSIDENDSSGKEQVVIKAAWSKSFSSGVLLTEPFILNIEGNNNVAMEKQEF